MSKPTLKVASDFTEEFNRAINTFKHDPVLIGIPEDNTERKDGDPISNAAILAINEFGSPLNNIPAWPVMSIGLKNAANEIAEQFKKAIKGTLTKGTGTLEAYYIRAGIIASNSVKRAINDQEGAPSLAESTIDARRARGFRGNKRLIVTGQVRNAITFVVKRKVG